MPNEIKALLDANVLYSNHLRNLLLQMAQNDLFDARWSETIEQEWLRNLEPATRARIQSQTLPLIRTWFPGALVTESDSDRSVGTTNASDRHVACTAVAISPCTLVTNNLRDFDFETLKSLDVAVKSPDDFLCGLFDDKPDVVGAVTREAAANLTKTCPSWDEYLDVLAERCGLPRFAERLKSYVPGEKIGPHST